MIRITTLLTFSFIFLLGSQYAEAQLAGPGTRPHAGTIYRPGTPATVPGRTSPGTIPSYAPQAPVYVPNSPTYIPSAPQYNPGYYNQSQVQAELNNIRQQEAQLRAELRQLQQQERTLRQQAIYQAPNGYSNGETDGDQGNGHHDNGRHRGWDKHGRGGKND